MAKPFRPSYASAHQPSRTERFRPPFRTTFWPLFSSLKRPSGIVQPNIDALHEMTSDVDIVVFYKDELVGKSLVTHQFSNLLQHPLARFIARVRLAGKYELHRTFRVVHDRGQLFDIRKN